MDQTFKSKIFIFKIIIVTVFIMGIAITVLTARQSWINANKQLIQRADTIRAGFHSEQIVTLQGDLTDMNNPEYIKIKEKLVNIKQVNPDLRFVYFLGYRPEINQVFIYADSEPTNSPDYSPPGDIYHEATAREISGFKTSQSIIEGPVTDRWGTWFSSFSPLLDENNQVTALLGIDIPANDWYLNILYATALPGSMTGGLTLLLLVLYYFANQRSAYIAELADKKQELEIILDSLPIGAIIAEASTGEITTINKMGQKLLGKPFRRSIGKDQYSRVFGLITEQGSPYPTNKLPLVTTLKTGKGSTKNDIFINRPDNKIINVRATSSAIKNLAGKMTKAVVVYEDMTKEHEVDKMKSEFVSLASHQLRTPLTGIKWFSELLLSGKAGPLTATQSDFLNQIYTSNSRMISLVGDLLNVSKIETGKKFIIKKTNINLRPIIDSIIIDLEEQIDKNNIKISYSEKTPNKIMVMADPAKMREAIANIISNAVKYSKPNQTILIETDSKPKVFTLKISDHGLGIPKDDQEKIFSKFFRAENIKIQEPSGTGLGLYITKEIITAHGGKIWFESVENKGTTFFISLPNK